MDEEDHINEEILEENQENTSEDVENQDSGADDSWEESVSSDTTESEEPTSDESEQASDVLSSDSEGESIQETSGDHGYGEWIKTVEEECKNPNNVIDFDRLLSPISEYSESGEDLSFSTDFDEIKEARRSDDPGLSQGEWQTDLKTADWRKVQSMCVEILEEKSKDLQVLGWLTEALGHQYGLKGAENGIRLTRLMMEGFWDTLYPVPPSEGDFEEREVRIQWFNDNVAKMLESVPVAKDHQRALSLKDWRESRVILNKTRDHPEYLEQALAEGKIDDQTFFSTVQGTSPDFYKDLLDVSVVTLSAIQSFEGVIDQKMGRHAPSLKEMKSTFEELHQLIKQLAQERGVTHALQGDSGSIETGGEYGPTTASGSGQSGSGGPIQNRKDAIRRLNEISQFFKRTEPYSPVGFLVDRAIKWGNMDLNTWLQEVIKDQSALFDIREMLGVKGEGGSSSESGSSSDEYNE